MHNSSLSGKRLGRQALLFPLCLVLYEFATYIGNDMIQPGMLSVVEEFGVGNEWVPTSMTAYLAGGMFLQWLLVHLLPWEMMFVLFAVLAAIAFFGLQKAMPETATRMGEKLSVKELGRDYREVLKNLRFVAGALATGFVSLPLLAWIAQSPVIIISGEQATSYEYGLLQVPIFGALIAGNLVLARQTSRKTVRSLIILGGWPIMIGLLIAAVATVASTHAYLWMTAGLSIYAFGIGLANAGLVRLTLFASEMSKGTVSAAMGMLQMLIFTVGIEVSKHAYEAGGSGLFSLLNLMSGVLWLAMTVYFLKDKRVGSSLEPQ